MRTCPACRKSIDARATKCPYCHTVYTLVEMNAGRDQSRRAFWLRALTIIMVVIAFGFWFLSPENIARMAEAEGERMAQRESAGR